MKNATFKTILKKHFAPKMLALSFLLLFSFNTAKLSAQTENLLIKNTWQPNKRIYDLKIANTLSLTPQIEEVTGDLNFLANHEFEMLRFNRECVSVPSTAGKPRKHLIKGDYVWINGGKWAVKEDEIRLISSFKKFTLKIITASEKEILLEVLNIE